MNLEFFQREAPQELLASKYANVGETGRLWDDYDLPPELLDHPLGSTVTGVGVDVVYKSENKRTELGLYARNPRDIRDTIIENAASGVLQNVPAIWDVLTDPQFLPQSVSIPPNLSKRNLYAEDFYLTTPPSSASVEAVRVYNHGACSSEVLTTGGDGLLDMVGNSLWEGFREGFIVDEGKECRTCIHLFLQWEEHG